MTALGAILACTMFTLGVVVIARYLWEIKDILLRIERNLRTHGESSASEPDPDIDAKIARLKEQYLYKGR